MSLTAVMASDADDTIASANDENLTVQTSTDDSAVIEQSSQEIMNTEQDSESNQGEVLSASSDEENGLLSAGSDEEKLTGTSTQLSNLISDEYVYLELPDDYSLTSAVYIYDKNGLVIDGKGHTIDGQGNRIFDIYSSCINITFKNIVFKNAGNSAIYFTHLANDDYSNFTFENCTFIDNHAPMYGGAIRANFNNNRGLYGEINLINCNFIGNSARNGGGVLYARNANNKYTYIYVTNCNFTNNSVTTSNEAAISGGVFHTYNCVDLYVKSSTFTGNSAVGSGGIFRSSGLLEIDDCEFYSNRAGEDGGCIYMGNTVGVLTVTNSKFEDNYARRWGGIVMGYGYRFESCTFNNNKVNTSLSASGKANTGRGGVMCSREGYSIVVADCNFTNNVAQEGGAICMEERASSISISGSTFNNNQATLKGGAFYSSVTTLATISTSTFEGNSANYGGAVWSSNDDPEKPNGRIIIQSSEFKSNTANIQGGALCLNTPRSEVVDSEFRFNTAPIGGAIYWNGNEGKVQGSTFESNSGLNGSSIYWAYANGNLVSSDFKDTAPSTGMVHWHGSNGAISQSTFEGTRAVHICSHASDVALTSNTQVSNSYDGPSVYLEGTASFDSNDFMNAIYNYGVILSQTYLVTLNNNTIITNVNSLPVFTRIEDDNGNPIRVRENMTLVYDSNNQLSTTFNHTDYVSSVSNLAIGLHNFTARGYNTANFNNIALKNGAVLYLVMNLTVNQTNYGEKVVFTVTLVNTTLNGTIGLDINDVHYTLPMSNGVANLILYNMAPNEYVVTATYMEYNQTLHTNVTIDVQLRNSTINVTANNITYGETVTININVTEGASGTVLVFVNNNKYAVTLKNSTAQLNLTGITGGTYNVFAVYNGDINFNGNDNSTQFTVKKFNSTVLINATDVDYGQTAIIEVKLPSDANGTTIVYVDSTPYEFTKQPITVSVANLSAGTHTVRVVYDGNDKYLPNSNSTVFKVNKIKITPTITVHNIKVGDNATITVNLNGATNATGLVLLTVNGNNYYVYANKTQATLILSGLPYGKYNVTATYLEDDIYYTATTNSSFTVDYVEMNPIITSSVDDDLNAIVNVTVPIDVNGDIVIEVNGTNYTAPVVKGKFSVQINGLEGGVYPAVMYFANDTKYHSVTKPFNITLNKIPTRIHIISEHIEVGDDATITVVVPTDAKGNVTIKINNENYTENVINGSAVFTVQGLTFGNYTIVAVYSGDRKYLSDEEDEVLIVRKVDPNPDSYINVTDIFVGEIATFNITMPSDLTAKINLTVQNKTYVVNITNGFGQINISGLKYGLPVPVHASFLGNDKYLGCERDYTAFSVRRITNYPMNITAVTDSSTANITVNIPSDANGIGYFTIDNRTFTIKYTNGKSNMTTVTDLIAGQEYVVYAYFDGNEKYTEGDVSRTLNSNKTLNYTFQASGTNILVGQTAYITLYLPNITNGTVTIKVPGRDGFTVDINETFVNGTYDYPVYNLAAGSYLCSVTYNGNDMYEASSRYGTIVVSKIYTSPRINFNTTYVGQNLTIQVTLPSDANGTVNITINNTRYSANVTNGTAYVIVPAGLRATTYSATLFYSGNEKYNNRTQTFPVIILRVSDDLFNVTPIDIYVGDNETITITLPADIDVNVTVSIPGTDYINKVHKLINGTVTFNVTGLAAGRYNVTASISGSSKYVDSSITRAFTVSTIGDYLFNLHDVATVYVRDNLTFILDLPDDAKGNVTVHIFDEDFTGEVKNGTATITVPTTAQGNYLFTISFEQEGKYNYKSQEGYAFVIKKDVELNPIYNSSVNVDENITITFVLPEDATGNVSVTSRGVTFTAELVNGTANVTLVGYPLSSTYSPSISYTGDDKYNPASGFIIITTHKVSDYNITVEVANITVDDVESVNITVPSDATEDVLVSGNFSNNTFSVKLTNGTATLDISDLPAGTYYINVRYQGYQKYADKNVTKIFRVDKVVPPISIEFTNNDTLTVKLPSLANGIANITIGDNPTVQIDIVNGVGSLNVSYLRPGSYFVNATFLGGVRYLENSTNITITIPKIEDYVLPIKVDDITVYENATIVVIVPEYATGNVNITIDGGEVIEVPIINGTATYDADGLKVGNHTVIATYEGDEYVFKTNSTNFTVSKVNTVLKDDVKYNATSLTVNLTLTETVTGNVTITIDGKPYNYYNIDSNKINLIVPTIPGTHIIAIKYSGDENHTVASDFRTIEISKIKDYNLTVNATPVITVIDNNVVTVTISKGIEGEITLYINGEEYDEYAIINSTTGKATLTLDRLPSGNYTLVAVFSSNVYDRVENSTTFEVIKLNTTISVNVTNITKDLTEVINVTLNENATGYVEIFINDVTFRVPVINGTAVLTRSNLVDKDYPIVVTYLGDDYYNTNKTTAQFTVSKIPVNITIKCNDIVIGQEANFTIETSRNITDQVTVRIDNRNYTAVVYNGKGNLIVLGQNVGTHNVTVFYAGDKDYLPANDTINVTVHDRLPTSISVNVTNITVGEKVTIYINVTGAQNGTVRIYMLGNPVNVTIVNGTGNYTYANLTARDYHFTAEYLENTYYKSSTTTGDFTVFKKKSFVTVKVDNINVGDVALINITISENTTGHVLVSFSNVHLYADINGTNFITLPVADLPVGEYNVTVTYDGDANFYNSTNKTQFNISKLTTTINITCNKTIVEKHPVVFNITTSANFTQVVIIRVNGTNFDQNFTSFVENGKGSFTVYNLGGGNYTATVLFPGNGQYYEARNTTNFTVLGKKATKLNVTVNNITLGENATVMVTVTGAQTGQVTLNIAGRPQTKDVVDGKVNFTVTDLSARDYHVTVTYIENDEFLSSNATADFTVYRKNSTVTVNVSDIKVGEDAIFNITVSDNATGHVLISFANMQLYAVINGSTTFSVRVADLPVGEYNVTVTYVGDSNYYNSTNKTQFNISKLTTTINITCDEIIIDGHPVVFTVATSANITEVVYIIVNGTNHTTFIKEGKGTFTVYGLASGNYTAVVEFVGNSKYDYVTNETKFNVTAKLPSAISINVTDVVLGENVTIKVNVTNGTTGRIALSIYGQIIVKDLVNSSATFVVSNLPASEFPFTVTYLGDNNYFTSNATGHVTVHKLAAPLAANVTNSTVGSVEYINVTINENATGNILISINGTNYYSKIEGGVARFNITGLTEGNYTAYITYRGDDNFNASAMQTNLTITKLTTTITISSDKVIIDGRPVVFTITTSANFTEVVYVEVNGTNHTTFVKEGKGTFTVYNLASGNYTAKVYFPGNTQYNAAENSTNFTVTAKLPSAISINVTDVVLGENVTIKVNVTNGTTGRIALSIYGQIIVKDLVNSSATFVVSNLPASEFPFTVTYLGDNNYFTSNATGHVTVHKLAAPLAANVTNSTVGSVEYINVTINENATGNILISINGTNYYSKIEDGVARFNITGLSEGNYTAYITYRGDDNFNASAMQTNLTITKLTTTITISTNSTIVIGHPVVFTITTSANLTEVVYVEVNGTNHTTFIKEGKGTFTVYGLGAGNYTAKVYFPGNTQYNAVDNSTEFNVTGKSPVSIAVSVNNITLGENAMVFVTVNATSGSVTLTIAGRPQTKAVDANGKVNFTVTDLIARDYFVTATYLGTDDYLSNVTNTTFTVFKKKSELSINVTNIFVGDNETIKINVTKGATGVVLIDIAGVQVYAILNNATSIAIALFDNLGIGTYNVTATYMGDNNYNGSSNNASFNVTKLKTSIIITGSNITVGQVETFNITTSANITEVITIEIDGVNYTTFIQNGKGTYTYYGLKEGTHTVYVYFAGNSKYDAEQNSTVVEVTGQKPSAVTVNVTSITVGENATIYVNVTDGATGYVMISIAGENHMVLLNNSKGNITIENLTARHYHVTAYYLGDDYYLGNESTAEFDVNKKATLINVTAVDITVDKNETITIKITNGTTGVVLIDINGTDYYANIVNGTAKLVVNNLAVGEYNVTVEYEGDANYVASVNSTRFNVTKLNSNINLIVVTPSPIAEGSAITINVTGPADATGIAIVSVKDNDLNTVQNYTVYINNGKGSLVLLDQPVGHYSVVANYQENYKYLANVSNTGAFEVYATGSNLNVKAENIYVGDNETIIVTVAGEYDENVTIKIGNLTYESPLVYNSTSNNSVATFKLDYKFPAGTYTVQASFISEDAGRIVTHEGRDSFIVSKINSTVGINNINDIKVGENVTITFTLAPSDATGTIDVYVNGERHIVNADNLTLTLTGLAAGHYFVQAMYGGDNKYLPSSANATFDVYKNNISIDLDVVSIKVNETEYINVTLESDAAGYVLININGTQYYAQIKGGKASVNVTGLEIGEYTVNATFIGDDKYYSNSTVEKFTVTKLATTIEIKGYDIFEGQDVVFTITTSANITEVVKIEVAGKNYTAFVENGKGNYTVSGLKVGNYNVTAYFPGNTKYDAVNDTTNITVKGKTKTSINVTVEDITVGDEITVVINATKGINDTVYVTIAGVAYTHTLVDGQGSFKVPNLIARDYVVSVFFMGNTEFELCNNTSNFTVHKKDTSIKVNVTDIYVDETEMIKVEVNKNATGNVLITIGEVRVYANLTDGVAIVNITGLAVGEYNVTVVYVGDAIYNGNSTNATFNVTKRSIGINITCDDEYVVGQPIVFTFKTSVNITEVVTITIGENVYHTFVENGTGTYTVTGLTPDDYTALVNFTGNFYYDPVGNFTTFKVIDKLPSSLTVNVTNITVGQNLVVKVNVTQGATGNITLVIAGNTYTEKINGNMAEFTIENLTARNYHITAYYFGDTYYYGSNATADFVVNKLNTTISAKVTNSTVGSVEYINVTLDAQNGTVLLSVNGSHYYADVINGVAKFNVTGLKEGVYTAEITYLENDRYNSNNTSVEINITKLSTTISIVTVDITEGQAAVFNITTSANMTQVVIVKIGENNYTTFVENGKGTLAVYDLAADSYTAVVTFPGNDQYNSASDSVDFTVSAKRASQINVTAKDITIGEDAVIEVSVTSGATGNVTIVIIGREYTQAVDPATGKATFIISKENLTARDYHVTAIYEGDTYYLTSNNATDFKVNKINTTISASVTNSTVGSVEYINVTVSAENGTVLLSVNGSHYYGEVINGVAKFNVTGLKEGVYTAEITYLENDRYNSNNTSVEINITKLSTTISIVTVDITEGQAAVFNITTSANMTQVVIVKIGENNYTTFVENGKGTLAVYDLAADSYTAVVTFPGNDQYNSASDSVDFTVSAKRASQINVTAKDITIGEDAVIEVSVTSGATGNVTIVIIGREYTQAVDPATGKATFIISKENLTARDYHVTAIYEGDTYYLTSNNATDFKVNKINTTISASVTNSTVGSVEYINVTVSAQNGTVLLNINGSHYYGEVINGVAKFNVTGLLVGNYTAEIRYVENDVYKGNYTEVKFTISKKSTTIIIKGHDITEGQTETLTITTSANITALVKIEIDGVNYTTFISEGKGTFTISNLTSGLKTAKVYYLGDDEYFAVDNQTIFNVDHKLDSEVNITVEDITIGDDENIIINVTKGATGNVTIVISGTEYVRPIDANGQVLFTKPASELMARDYSVTVIYEGDTYYKGSKNTANFTVSKKPSSVDLEVHDITVGDTEIINVNVTSGATGMVLINVSGTYYYADLKDGKATFNVAGLKAGEYTAIVTYAGDDNYNRSVASKAFVVHPQVTLEPGVNNGTVTPITVKVSDNATGDVTVVVNGTPYTAKVENGTATVYVKDAQPGEQNVTVIYDDGKNPVTQNQTVDIPKVTGYDVNVTAPDVKVGENGTITVKLPEDATGNVTVKVGNQTIPAKVENGTAVVNVSDLPVGSYDVDVAYSGDDKYAGTNTKSHINVAVDIPTINAVEKLVRGWNSIYDYEAVFLDKFGNALEGVNVTFIVNGKSYTVLTEKHGVAKLTTSHLDVGEYNITSINPVTGESVTKELSVVPRLIHNKDITMDFMDGTYYTVLVIGDDGNPVGEGEIIDIYVNTIHYVSKTNKDGLAKLKINLNPTKYKVMAEYKNYKVYNKLVVKQTLKLVKKTVSVKKGKKIVLKAKLKWTNGKVIKGKKIVFKFKGKKYSAKTNKKGIAKVTIKKKSVLKKLKKGKKYSFTASYKTNKVKGKVKIKK